MAVPGGPGIIHADLEGILGGISALGVTADEQKAQMQQLASAIEHLSISYQGPAGQMARMVSMDIRAQGDVIAGHYDDHKEKMQNNHNMFQNEDDHQHQVWGAIQGMLS